MKISVLTPTHNRANLLPKLYQSLKENNKLRNRNRMDYYG